MSVHDAHAAGRGHNGRIEELLHALASFLGVLADDVNLWTGRMELRGWLEGDILRQLALFACRGQHFQDIVDRYLHLEEARLHFDAIVAKLAAHPRRLADSLQTYARTFFD